MDEVSKWYYGTRVELSVSENQSLLSYKVVSYVMDTVGLAGLTCDSKLLTSRGSFIHHMHVVNEIRVVCCKTHHGTITAGCVGLHGVVCLLTGETVTDADWSDPAAVDTIVQ